MFLPGDTCSGVDEHALVGSQVAKVEEHHVGGDVIHREGCSLFKSHPVWDEEGVAGRHCRHILPQPVAVQHHHFISHLKQKVKDMISLVKWKLFDS